jgi:hypothetical protein
MVLALAGDSTMMRGFGSVMRAIGERSRTPLSSRSMVDRSFSCLPYPRPAAETAGPQIAQNWWVRVGGRQFLIPNS